MLPGRAAGRKSLIMNDLRKQLGRKRANLGQSQKKSLKKIFTESQKNRLRSPQIVLP
jgi:hypothetical protein